MLTLQQLSLLRVSCYRGTGTKRSNIISSSSSSIFRLSPQNCFYHNVSSNDRKNENETFPDPSSPLRISSSSLDRRHATTHRRTVPYTSSLSSFPLRDLNTNRYDSTITQRRFYTPSTVLLETNNHSSDDDDTVFLPEREQMCFDVLIVGGGPAGLAAAIRMKQLCIEKDYDLSVCMIDKGR
jgi:hypothetical protein